MFTFPIDESSLVASRRPGPRARAWNVRDDVDDVVTRVDATGETRRR